MPSLSQCPVFLPVSVEMVGTCVCVLWQQVHTLQPLSLVWSREVAGALLTFTSQTATFLSCYISSGTRGFQFPLTDISWVLCTVVVSQLECVVVEEHLEPVAAVKLECSHSSPQQDELPGVHPASPHVLLLEAINPRSRSHSLSSKYPNAWVPCK